MKLTSDRRRQKRFFAESIPSSLRLDNDTEFITTESKNISKTGIRVNSRRELVPGEDLTVILLLQGYRDTLEIPGKVVWSYTSQKNLDNFEAGIQFSRLTGIQKKLLTEYIEHHYEHDLFPAP